MSPNEKIKTINDLSSTLEPYRKSGRKIVYCHGIFDLLHIGHIRLFEQARRMGDVLVVSITPDRFAAKGSQRTIFTETLRAEAVASLNFVDYVTINSWPTAEETLRLIRPDIYAKGSDSKPMSAEAVEEIEKEEEVVREIGACMAYTEDIAFSSTNLINRYLSTLPAEINEYIELFRKRYTHDDILRIIDRMASLNVLVIGDTILDDYQYCDVIGKSSKDPTLAMKYTSNDLFAGGVLAVANHVSNFAGNVQLVTRIGERDSHEDFIRSQLHSNISPHFIVQPNAPTLIKRRFIDGYSITKLFEIYVMDDSGLPPEKDLEVCRWLEAELPKYDIVIASDFGHGAISNEMVRILADHSHFLAVNTQANAGNRGFHTISRYPRADYACIAEHELRLETRLQNGNIWPMMYEIRKKLGCTKFVVTRGRKGCAVCNGNGSFVQIPSFAQNIVDRVGAGDAFLSVTSLAAVQGVQNEVLGFIGNVVGSIAVEIMGNKKSIDKQNVKEYITSLMR